MGSLEHFAAGAIFGFVLSLILSRDQRWRAIAPVLIVVCGAWAVFPYILTEIFMIPKQVTESLLFNIFFFYPLLKSLNFTEHNALSIFVIWLIYVFTCVQYIKYIKELIRHKEALEKYAK